MMLGQAVDLAEELCPDILIPIEGVNPFKATSEGTFRGQQCNTPIF